MSPKSLRGAAVLLAVVALASSVASSASGAPATRKLTHVTCRMGYTWASSQYYVAYLVGVKKGFYAKQGLDVTFQEGNGSGTTVQLVANGKADFGCATAVGAVIGSVSKGAPVKMVAATLPFNPIAVISQKSKPILKPKDLVGKKIGMPPGTEQEQLWPAFLEKNKLTSGQMTLVSIAGDALPAALKRGQIDGYVSYTTDVPFIRKVGLDPVTMLLPAFGLTYAPGEGVVAPNSTIKNNPDLVRRFVTAVNQSWQYALSHEAETAALGAAMFPDSMTKGVAQQTLDIVAKVIKGRPFLTMTSGEWAQTLALLHRYGGLGKTLPPASYFTNVFASKVVG